MSPGIFSDEYPAQEQNVEEQPAVQPGKKANGPDQRWDPSEAV
jgi:hypothetical protein